MNNTTKEQPLRDLIAETLRRDLSTLGRDADLVRELGLDSLSALRVLAMVEKRFGVRFPDHRLGEFRTIGRILDHMQGEGSR